MIDGRNHNVVINDFKRFMYDHSLHHGKKYFCRYRLHALFKEKILKHHIKDWFIVKDKQTIKMAKKGENNKLKNFERK